MPRSVPSTLAAVGSLLCLTGCGPGRLAFGTSETSGTSESTTEIESTAESESTTETESESTTETETTETETTDTETETGDGDPGACDCTEYEVICTRNAAMAMHDCELPNPCGIVDKYDAEAAECVLELLIAGEPARFEYDIASTQGCDTGYNNQEGWFYILGPDEGLDNECFIDECENGFGEPPSQMPTAMRYTIDEPAHFADCLGGTASAMTNCIFSGLTSGSPIAECRG
jgi:hypothetical protein